MITIIITLGTLSDQDILDTGAAGGERGKRL